MKTAVMIKSEIGLRLGMKVKITEINRSMKPGRNAKIFKGEVIDIPNDHNFDVHNGIWRESFSFTDVDVPGGIRLEVLL